MFRRLAILVVDDEPMNLEIVQIIQWKKLAEVCR
jgi:hypothetical protein